MNDLGERSVETGGWRLETVASAARRNSQSLWLWGILIVAALVRFYRLDASSLWSDEGNTWAQLGRNFGQIAQAAAADIHPPGYYWLLKAWTAIAGHDAFGMRSFSAVAGVVLVYVVYRIALIAFRSHAAQTPCSRPPFGPRIPHLCALLAALNPFQIYYSQEARMYMLLTLAGAGLMWATLSLIDAQAGAGPSGRKWLPPALGYLVCATVGLWTHYSFPILLAAAGIAYLFAWLRSVERTLGGLVRFAALNGLVILLFAPWLPTALARVQAWPKGGVDSSWSAAIAATLRTLLLGPLRNAPVPLSPWLLAAGLLPLIGLWAMRRRIVGFALALWLLAPIGLMFGLGLYSPAFLKFLLIASPAWCLAVAACSFALPPLRNLVQGAVALGAIVLAIWVLPASYRDPTVRDNYAGVAAYIAAVGDPARDLVILDAPGQQEVWRYYDPGLPVLALPQQRPADPEQTTTSLTAAVQDRRQIFALYWATDEADPDLIVERWLGANAFKGVESWQGNLRFATYSRAAELTCTPQAPPTPFGDRISLTASCRTPAQDQITPGEVLLLGLRWQTATPIEQRYKVTVQLLDARGQVIAQHDDEPAGGTEPSDRWPTSSEIVDNHGLFIPFGTPPGHYALIAALYDPATGARLLTSTGDHVSLGSIELGRSRDSAPLDILPIANRVLRTLGPVKLLGYNLHRKGYAHAPKTPVPVGEQVEVTFFWQMPDPPPPSWPDDLFFTLQLGDQQRSMPLAGGNYPTAAWRAGEVVRATFDLTYDGTSQSPILTVAEDSLRLHRLPTK